MKDFPYGHNYLLTETAGNLKKTDELVTNSQGTLDRVGLTNPLVKAQAVILKSASVDFNSKYLVYVNLKGISYNATRKADAIEKTMIKTLRNLDKDVQHFYDEDTEEYRTIFVKGRSTNYEGLSSLIQIQNYKSISMNMDTLSDVSDLKDAFDDKITAYADAVKFSTDSKTDLDEQLTLLEAARILWCTKGYGVIGGLMIIFDTTPEKVGDFFDLSIFNTRQSHIDPDAGAEVVALPVGGRVAWNGVFDPSKYYQIHYLGFESLTIGSAPTADTHPLTNPCTMKEDETRIFAGGELGPLTNRYLIFISNDTVLPGELKIKEVDGN